MRIYLDSNVFRDLKKEESKELLEIILKDKETNYYCFSEAHIQDLVQDSTDKKLNDMDFMETIVSINCWHYNNENIEARFSSPKDYYEDFEWGAGTDIMTSNDPIQSLIRESFRAVPLNWNSLIDKENLPSNFPDDLKSLLLEPVTMLDFMDAMLDMTENISKEQQRFRRLLKFLHGSLNHSIFYEQCGIKGFDGEHFTDWESFVVSFKALIHERAAQKKFYNLLHEMHYALDTYGIVKGKPKKQKFMSLLNDGKHAYYAAHAHVLVTSDQDMIAKTKLLYRIWEIETMVLTPSEFAQWLNNLASKDNSVAGMFSQFKHAAGLPTSYEEYGLDRVFVQKDLPTWYLGEFNTLNCATSNGNTYYYFKQFFRNIQFHTLTVELERVVNKLVEHFGADELGRAKFERSELENNEWKGREWRIREMGVIMHLNQGIVISFFKAAPLFEQAGVE